MHPGIEFVIYMQSTPINRRAVVDSMVSGIRMTVAATFGTMEMAFVYGVVTLALGGPVGLDGSKRDQGSSCRVAQLLNQAGYDVVIICGRKERERHEWLEVGHPGQTPELIVDISTPDHPHDTVLPKSSRKGSLYSARENVL